jgi:DNA-binding transcriptional LysR family regulator
VLPSALVALTRQFPEIQVEVSEGTPDRLYESLMFGHVDFVVGRVMPLASIPGVESERLYDDEVRVVCTPDHPRATHTGTLGELVDDAWVLPPSDTSLRGQIEEDFIRDCGRTPVSVIECVAALPLRSLVLRGELLAVVPSGIFTDELERGSLVALPMQVGGAPVAVGIVSRAGAEMTASAGALVDALRAAVADRPST